MATGHFAPERLQPVAPQLRNIYFLIKQPSFFFCINKKLCPTWKVEQNKSFKGVLNAVSIFFTLYPKYSVPPNKIESIVIIFFFCSVLEKNPVLNKKQIQCCSLLLYQGWAQFLRSREYKLAGELKYKS